MRIVTGIDNNADRQRRSMRATRVTRESTASIASPTAAIGHLTDP